jgi:hypothetical protein
MFRSLSIASNKLRHFRFHLISYCFAAFYLFIFGGDANCRSNLAGELLNFGTLHDSSLQRVLFSLSVGPRECIPRTAFGDRILTASLMKASESAFESITAVNRDILKLFCFVCASDEDFELGRLLLSTAVCFT